MIIRIPEIILRKLFHIKGKCHPLHIGIDHGVIPFLLHGIAEDLTEIGKLFIRVADRPGGVPFDLLCIIDDRPGDLIRLYMLKDKFRLFHCLSAAHCLGEKVHPHIQAGIQSAFHILLVHRVHDKRTRIPVRPVAEPDDHKLHSAFLHLFPVDLLALELGHIDPEPGGHAVFLIMETLAPGLFVCPDLREVIRALRHTREQRRFIFISLYILKDIFSVLRAIARFLFRQLSTCLFRLPGARGEQEGRARHCRQKKSCFTKNSAFHHFAPPSCHRLYGSSRPGSPARRRLPSA